MFRIDQFERELRKDNSHYERFKKSSLHDLVALLKRPMPKATPHEVATEMAKITDAKWTKYGNAKRYLLRSYPRLHARVLQHHVPMGESIPGYQPGKWERRKDVDGRWHEFILQNKGNSCGPACVLTVKQAWHPIAKHQLREPQIRGIVALHESGKTHTGLSELSPEAIGLHNWKNVGSNRAPLLKTLIGQPFPVSSRGVNLSSDGLFDLLGKCTASRPAIVGWLWAGGGGHWTAGTTIPLPRWLPGGSTTETFSTKSRAPVATPHRTCPPWTVGSRLRRGNGV